MGQLTLTVEPALQKQASSNTGRLFCRPEAIDVAPAEDAGNRFAARVVDQIYLGNRYRMVLELDALPGQRLMADVASEVRATLPAISEQRMWVALPQHALHLFS